MAAVKLKLQKKLTLNGIQRLEKNYILDRNAIIQKIQARIRQERSNLLNSRREARFNDENESTIACRLAKQDFYRLFDQETNLDNLITLEEQVLDENVLMYENWLMSEAERAIEEEEGEGGLVCPVCCRHLLQDKGDALACSGCCVSYANKRGIEEVRQDIGNVLSGHNSCCKQCPVFTYVADSNHTASMLLLCHSCSYLNIIL